MKKFLTILITLALVCAMTLPVFAAGTVTFDGNAQKFIFAPGSKHSPTDLFSDFKGVMPGDKLTQDITVNNDVANGVKVNLYIRSRGAQPGSEEFLSKLRMTVAKDESGEMAYMFDAAADQTAGMTDWVLLGTLYSGGKVDLKVTLEVPLDMGNEFQNAIGYLDWDFKVEELPVDPDDPKPPYTGDDNQMLPYVGIMVVSVVVLIVVVLLGKRKKQAEND